MRARGYGDLRKTLPAPALSRCRGRGVRQRWKCHMRIQSCYLRSSVEYTSDSIKRKDEKRKKRSQTARRRHRNIYKFSSLGLESLLREIEESGKPRDGSSHGGISYTSFSTLDRAIRLKYRVRLFLQSFWHCNAQAPCHRDLSLEPWRW